MPVWTKSKPILSYSIKNNEVVEEERKEDPRSWLVVERKELIRMSDGRDQIWSKYVGKVEELKDCPLCGGNLVLLNTDEDRVELECYHEDCDYLEIVKMFKEVKK